MKKAIVIFLLVLPFMANSQQWKKYRREALLGGGAANVLSDLGGADQIGTHLMKDLEISMTRPMVGGGYRYKISPTMAVKAFGGWGRLTGNDQLTKEPARNNRNLSFKTHIIEFTGQYEYSVIEEKLKSKYSKYSKKIPLNVYFFGGIGLFYFNPKAQYWDGTWYDLRLLNTEGQGLPGSEGRNYKRIQLVIPLGIGFKYPITREWSVGLEYGMRKTFTDYIDDVSTVYFNKEEIRANFGEVAAYFADPSTTPTRDAPIKGGTNPGEKRGDPTNNDTYMFVWLSASYKITAATKSRVKF